MNIHSRFDGIYEQLKDALRFVTSCRDTSQPDWIELELDAFLVQAQIIAATADLTIPTRSQVERCDTHAAGHVDWNTKLPLYVAEIMFDRSPLVEP